MVVPVTVPCENASYSHKKGRLYCRLFNHQEARDLRAQGWTYKRLAEHFGVTRASVVRACDPEQRAKFDARAAAHTREHSRADCKGGCGARVWTHVKGRSGFCRTCYARERSVTVRDTTLRCSRCMEWLPDSMFPKATANKARRQRAAECSSCQTLSRRERRERTKVPCTACGEPCTPANERRPGEVTTLCRGCWGATVGAKQLADSLSKAVAHSVAARGLWQ